MQMYNYDPPSYCPRDITSASVWPSYNTANCRSGQVNNYCYQGSCASGLSVYLGYWYIYCTNSAWSMPSL